LIGIDQKDAPAQSAREESFAGWRRYVEALAEAGTTVLVFEDLHWADSALLDLVMHVSEWIEDVPLLIVATARPELFDRRPDWGGGKRNATTLSLTALDRVETSRLISALLDRAVLPADVQAALLERADGNPFYAEQYARMVAEGGEAAALPDSVQGIIAARLDSLDPEEKALLQSAAVLGKTFATGSLERMTDQSRDEVVAFLRSLDRKEFIRRERRPSLSSDQEYSFRHVLLRDVAYGQIPRRARIEKHRAAADWIESLGRPRDHAELLAHHYASALDLTKATGRDAGSLVDPARRALRAAGDRALALNAFASADALYRRALELWPRDDVGRASLLAHYGRAVSANGGDAIPLLSEAVATAPDPETAAEAGTYLAWAYWETGQTEEAFHHLHASEARVRERPDSAAKAIVLTSLARYLTVADRDAEGVAVGREALRLAETLGLEEYRIWALHYLGLARTEDDRAAGIADIERSIELARAAKSTFLVYALNNLASLSWGTFGIDRSLAVWAECRAETERLGLRAHARFLDAIDVAAHYVLGRWDQSFDLADSIVREAEAGAGQYGTGPARLFRALIRVARDDARGALDDVEHGLAAARAVRDPQAVVPALCNAIAARAEAAGIPVVAPLIDEYFDILRRRRGGEYFFGWCGNAVDVFDRAGRGEEFLELTSWRADRCVWLEPFRAAIEHDYVRAAELYARIGSPVDEALGRLRAAQSFAEAGRRAEADEQLAPALEFFRAVRATRYVREGEALLAAAS
jgi:tetratricopeptide (TPR) repeat protein